MLKFTVTLLFIALPLYAAYQPDVSSTIINTVAHPVPVNLVSGTISVSTSGTSTAANQVIANASLNNIDGSLATMSLGVGVSGSSVPFYSYFMSGSDGSNAHNIKTDTAGVLQTNILNSSIPVTGTFWQTTQPVSIAQTLTVSATGNSTVNQGTSPWVTSISGQPLFSLGGVSTTGVLSVSQSGNVGVNQVSTWASSISGVSTTSALSVSTTGINLESLMGVSTTSPLNVRISAVSSTDVLRVNLQAVSTTLNVAQSGIWQQSISGVSTTGILAVSATGNSTVNQGTSPWVISGSVSPTGNIGVTQITSPWVSSISNQPLVSIGAVSTTGILSVSATGNSAVNQNGIWNFGLNAVSTTAALNTAITSVSTSGLFNTSVLGVSTTSSLNVAQSTATNLKTQAENYQGGAAVASGNPLYVSLAGVSTSTAVPVSFSSASFSIVGVSTTSALNNNISGVSTTAVLNSSILGVSTTSVLNVSGTTAGINPSASVTSVPITGLDSGNSTAVALGANAVFTGTYKDVSAYSNVTVNVSSDQSSAADGFQIQYSSDGTNLDSVDKYTIPAGGGKQYSAALGTKFFRVVYTNGGTIQGAFRLQTKLHAGNIKPSSIRIADSQTDQDDVPLTKSIIAAMNGTSTANVVLGPNNSLTVSETNMLPNFVTTATVSAPNAASTSFVAKTSNANRKGLEIMNTTDVNCWFAKTTTVTSTTSTVYLLSGSGYYNMPYPIYTGQIQGICSGNPTTGAITVTEY